MHTHRESNGSACCCEILCCLIFGFPCIFLCHPCCVEMAAKERIPPALTRLNIAFFNGQPVLSSTRHDIISVDTSRIQLTQSVVVVTDGVVPNPAVQNKVGTATAVPVAQQVVKQSEFRVVVPDGTILSPFLNNFLILLFVLCKVHPLVQKFLWLILKGLKCWSLSRMVPSLVSR